ncbi:unnamed protein product [Blepharisma stoltei]|uniref:SAM-dependent MTase RsmB/NOP-type domain-containing protein n=1 Tax=Blepharisma stoltei TaxID=1481888 RepID=A0AAU9II01_9CILI|nr:unnamed protein product [Blepharisma stoltei]
MSEEISVHVSEGNDTHMKSDLGLVHMKIQELVQTLVRYKDEPREKTRSEYLDELVDNIIIYYEYNRDLAAYLASFFPPAELVEFLEANQTPRPMVIRTNTLKTKRRELAQSLIQKGVNLDPVGEWSKVGLKIIESQVPIGATTEYLAGHYMLQSASSFLPVMALAPKPGERILDMCAAPGGKTTHIGQLMKNTGVLVANEMNKDRLISIKGNVHRLGITNCIITNYDGRKIGKVLNGFDRVLLDAPCSGLGVIWKDQSVKAMRTTEDIKKNSHIQKELLLEAIDVVNARSSTGGYIVYSTCSISIEENEEVISYALKNRHVKIVDTGLTIGEPGLPKFKGKIFHPSMTKCKRIYPHVYNMEGFFVCKLKKYDNEIPQEASKPHSGEKREKAKKQKTEDSDMEIEEEKVEIEEENEQWSQEKKQKEKDKKDAKRKKLMENTYENEELENLVHDLKEKSKKEKRNKKEKKDKKHEKEVKEEKSDKQSFGDLDINIGDKNAEKKSKKNKNEAKEIKKPKEEELSKPKGKKSVEKEQEISDEEVIEKKKTKKGKAKAEKTHEVEEDNENEESLPVKRKHKEDSSKLKKKRKSEDS